MKLVYCWLVTYLLSRFMARSLDGNRTTRQQTNSRSVKSRTG